MKEELFVITKKFLCTILIILTICSCVTPMVSIVYASVAGSYDGTNAYDINNNRVNLNGPSNPQKVADLSAVNSEGNPNPAGNPVNVDGTAYNRFGVYSNGSNIIQSDNKYSYSFIPNKNTTVSFWNESNEEDGNILISSTNKEINVVPSHNNQSGKIGCYIKNLGLYIDENSEIHEISLKCTFYWESFISMGIEQYPLIRLIANANTKRIIFSFYNQSYKIKFDIYDSDPELGGNLTNINFSTYISDIDGYQFVGLGNFNGEADGGLSGHVNEIQSMAGGYIYTDTTPNTTYKNYKWFYAKGGDRYNLLQDTIRVELDNVNSFEMVYGCPNDYPSFNYGDRMYKDNPIEPTRDEIIQRIRDKRQNAGITFSGESYVRYDIENPVEKIDDVNQKNVESNQVGIDEEFYYKIYHRVPDENSAFYYNSYTIETILPEGVEYQEANVYKSYGKDDNENTINSEDFEINYDETTRKVTAVAKNVRTESFYNEIYMLKIKIKLQKDNIQDITENSEETIKTYLLNNHSTVRVNRNNNQTNMNLIDGSTYTIHPIDKDNNNNLIARTDYAIQLNSGAIELAQYVNTYSSQKFIIKYEGSGYYSFRKGNSALTSDTNNVGKLRTASYTLDENDHIVNDKQLWRIMKAGDFYIISPKVYNGSSSVEKRALTANTGEYTNGGLLDIQFIPENYTDNIYQLFSLERVDTDAVSSTDIVLETNEVNTTYYEKKIDIIKQWNDDANNLGTRPESINFTVSDGNTVVDSGTITADGTNSQTVKTKYLPILNNLEQVIDYQVSENDITGYTPNYTTTKDEDGVSLLKIDNNLNEYEYRVEYYYDEVIDNSRTVRGTAKYNDVISSYTAKNKTGFVFDRDVGKPLTIGTDETANVIKVYYRRRTDLKGTVNYYLDGTTQKLIDSKNLTGLRYQDVLQASSYREEIEGYTYTRANPASITVKTSASSNVLNLYYTPNNYNYTVEYYYNNVRDDSKTDTLSAAFNSTIETVEDKVTEGYRHDRTETLPFTITSNPDNNIIKVYYVTDDGNTKNLKYTVEYYKNGIKQTADTQVVNKTVQVLEPDTLAVDFTKINTTNKYVGYRFDHSTPSTIPETVPTNTVIKIYYVKRTDLAGTVNHYLEGTTIKVADSENLNNLEFEQVLNASDYIQNIPGHTYTGADPATITVGTNSEQNVLNLYYAINRYDYSVEYYYNGVQDTDAKETYSADYNSEITEYTDKNKPGFKLDRAEPVPLVIGENETENVLRVYYITDPTQKKSLHYTVEYYKDGTKVSADTQTESIEVQYLEPDTLTVDQSKINTEDKYEGYRFDHSTPETIPSTVNTGDVIKIYYVKRTDLTGKVNYYLKGTTTRVRNPITLTGLQFQQVKKASSYKKTVTGYTYDSANPTSITVGVDPEQNVLNLYYTKNIYEYTVEYYYNNIKDEDATEHGEAEYKSKITTYIDKPKAGYMFSSVESLPLTITANSENNVIKVYYVTDDGQTKPLSYTVEYYKDGVKQTEDTQTESITVQYLEPNTLTVDKTKINTENKYEGYVFSHTDPASIPETVNNGDVIKVYYVKRQDLTGTVNHYLQGTTTRVAPTETLENLEFEQVVSAADHIANIEGYTYVGASPTSITIGVDSEQNVLNLYYTINSYGYTVEYYYNNVKDNSKTINGTADYNTVIETVPDKNITGYRHDRTTNLPLTIGTNPNDNIVKVYYVIDDGNTKDLEYTVKYYKDGVLQTADTQIESKTVQVLEPDTLTVDKTKINTENKYLGYRFDHSTPAIIPDTVNTGTTIEVYYVKRSDLTGTVNYYLEGTTTKVADSKDLTGLTFEQIVNAVDHKKDITGYTYVNASPESITVGLDNTQNVLNLYYRINNYAYTVEYYYDGIKDTTATENRNADYNTVISTYPEKNRSGYKFEKHENVPLTIGTNPNNNVIKVYYIIDDEQTKLLHYTVEYYKDGVKQNSDTQTVEERVQLLADNVLNVKKEEINTTDKYEGYVFANTNPTTIPDTINHEGVIKVYYNKRTDLLGTVNYYLEGTTTKLIPSKDLTGLTFEEVEKAIDHKENIPGYSYVNANPDTIIVGVDSTQNILNLYYAPNDYQYTIEYYYNDIKDDSLTKNLTAKFNSTITEYPPELKQGFKFSRTENLPLTIGIDEIQNIIKVYYVTDDGQTKTLSYTVEYYKDGEKVEEDTQIESIEVQVLEPNTLTVDKTKINTSDKYEGYEFKNTDPENIPDTVNTGTVIKVYYEIRKDLSGIVNYYLKGTTTKVADSKTLENLTYNDVINATSHKKEITGYSYDSANPISLTVSTREEDNVINIYYTINKYKYTVEYYYNNIKDETATDEIYANYNTQITEYTQKPKEGYEFSRDENLPLTIGTTETQNVIKVYYSKKTNLKGLVNYLIKGTQTKLIESKELNNLTFQDEITAESQKVKIVGYDYDGATPESIIVGENSDDNILNLYYTEIKGILEITKVDTKTNEQLQGAIYQLVKITDGGEIDTSFTLQERMTNGQGKAQFEDLTYGTYRLTETKAPEGYKLLSEPIEIIVNESTLGEHRIIEMTIKNTKKNILPATGGNGAKIIIINGILLLSIAYMIKKKKIYIVKK